MSLAVFNESLMIGEEWSMPSMFCNEEQGPQKMEELFLHLLKDRDQNVKGGSLSRILKYTFFIFVFPGYTNNHDHIHRMNCAEITLIVSSVITTKINRHPSDLQQLCIRSSSVSSWSSSSLWWSPRSCRSWSVLPCAVRSLERWTVADPLWRSGEKFGLRFDFSHQILNYMSFFMCIIHCPWETNLHARLHGTQVSERLLPEEIYLRRKRSTIVSKNML